MRRVAHTLPDVASGASALIARRRLMDAISVWTHTILLQKVIVSPLDNERIYILCAVASYQTRGYKRNIVSHHCLGRSETNRPKAFGIHIYRGMVGVGFLPCSEMVVQDIRVSFAFVTRCFVVSLGGCYKSNLFL